MRERQHLRNQIDEEQKQVRWMLEEIRDLEKEKIATRDKILFYEHLVKLMSDCTVSVTSAHTYYQQGKKWQGVGFEKKYLEAAWYQREEYQDLFSHLEKSPLCAPKQIRRLKAGFFKAYDAISPKPIQPADVIDPSIFKKTQKIVDVDEFDFDVIW